MSHKTMSHKTMSQKTMIHTKRVYDPAEKTDGFRVLVDRLWPRGLRKDEAHLDLWLKAVAPSAELRIELHHEMLPDPEFEHRYRAELEAEPTATALAELRQVVADHPVVTLLSASKQMPAENVKVLLELLG